MSSQAHHRTKWFGLQTLLEPRPLLGADWSRMTSFSVRTNAIQPSIVSEYSSYLRHKEPVAPSKLLTIRLLLFYMRALHASPFDRVWVIPR